MQLVIRVGTWMGLLLVACATPGALPGQAPVHVISGSAACSECRIQRHLVVTLEDDSLPGVVGPFAIITVTSSGEVILTRRGVPTPFVANPKGRVYRQIGRGGSGPGEFRMPLWTVEHRGGYVVFDGGLGRVTRLDRALTYTGAGPLPLNQLTVPLPIGDSGFVTSTGSDSRWSDAGPLHFVSWSGRVKSFGGRPAPGVDTGPSRLIAAAGNGTIWAGYRNKYVIERWDTAGTLVEVLDRRVSWFPAAPAGDVSQRSIRNIHVDNAGLLWVHSVVRAPTLVTYIEVLDPIRRQVIATAKVDNWAGDPAYGGLYVHTHRALPSGEPRIDVWGFRLSRPNERNQN